MKKLIEDKYFKLGLMIFSVVALSILFFFFIFKLEVIFKGIIFILKILTPFILGFVFAYLLNPVVKFINKKIFIPAFKKAKFSKEKTETISRVSSILLTCIVVLSTIIILIYFIIPELLTSLEILITNTPAYLEQIKIYLLQLLKNNKDLETIVLNNYDMINTYVMNAINSTFLPKIEELVVIFSNGVFGALKVLYNIILGFIISIYFLNDKEIFKGQLKKALYGIFNIKKANKIIENARHTNIVFGEFIISKVLISIALTIFTFMFLVLFGYPYAIVIAVLIGVTNIIPYFGPFIGGIPSVLIILLQAPTKVWALIIFIILVQQLEGNYITPKLTGMKMGIKSFWVLFAIIVFGAAFGVPGMILGVPIFALLYGYIKSILNNLLLKKKLTTETSSYANLENIEPKNYKMNYKDD